jgi:hypothetical protein
MSLIDLLIYDSILATEVRSRGMMVRPDHLTTGAFVLTPFASIQLDMPWF